MKTQRFLVAAAGFLTFSLAAGLAQESDAGEAPEALKLKGRSAAPAAADVDSAVTLKAMLSAREKSAFSEAKGATIEGWVVQVEREEDGDYHVALGVLGEGIRFVALGDRRGHAGVAEEEARSLG